MLTKQQPTFKSGSRGFTMIEIMVASAALGIIAAAIYAFFGTSMRLYTNGVSAARTGYALREVQDRIAFDIAQSPGRYASAMALDTASTPARLNETMGVASSALGLCKVVAGPLMIQSYTASNEIITAAVLVKPPQTDTTTGELVADPANFSIEQGDYIKLIIGDAIEKRVKTVGNTGTTWTLTFDDYSITYANSSSKIENISEVPVYVVRYGAYLVLKNLDVYGRARDCLAFYDKLEVVNRRGGVAYNPPSTFKLPANHTTAYTELVSTDLTNTTLTSAGDGWQPFRFYYDTEQPTVLLQLGVKATEYDKVSNNPDFYRTANLDTSFYLRSNDL